jgi:hypothetical protein
MFKTDLDLANSFTRAVAEPYSDGVEFLTALAQCEVMAIVAQGWNSMGGYDRIQELVSR